MRVAAAAAAAGLAALRRCLEETYEAKMKLTHTGIRAHQGPSGGSVASLHTVAHTQNPFLAVVSQQGCELTTLW